MSHECIIMALVKSSRLSPLPAGSHANSGRTSNPQVSIVRPPLQGLLLYSSICTAQRLTNPLG